MKLTDVPRSIDAAAYDAMRDTVRQTYTDMPGVAGVVESGRVLHPGISDMDFIVIVEPGSSPPLPKFGSYTEQERTIMVHKHFVMSTNTYPHVSLVDPWMRDVTPLVGGEQWHLKEQSFSADDRASLSFAFMMGNSLTGMLTFLIHSAATQQIPVRKFMEEAKYSAYYERELKAMGLLDQHATDTSIALYQGLREEWFAMDAQQRERSVHDALSALGPAGVRVLENIFPYLEKTVTLRPRPAECAPHTALQKNLLKTYPRSVLFDLG